VNLTAAVKSRAAATAAGILVFLAIFFSLAGPSWQLALYRITQDGGSAILWLISAGGFGWIIWKAFQLREKTSLMPITCVALGLGTMSLGILGMGLMGWMNQKCAIGILGAGDLIAITAVYSPIRKWNAAQWFVQPADWGWLWIAPAAVAGVVALAACFPPGILWGDEPNGYDVIEYHLQVPREWYEAGRITALHHNVFSYFPFNVEMHYLLAMYLHGGFWGPWAGMYLAQMMHMGFCAASVWAVYALAGGGRQGIVAGAIMAAVPWTGLLAAVAYNEGGTLLFGILAIGWAIRADSRRDFALAGLFAGFAAGTKLSMAPLILAAVPIVVFITRPKCWAGCAVYLLAAILVLSPWLIRDWKWTGNPVFPEAMRTLGQDHFSNVQAERWRQAYWPHPKYRSAIGRLRGLWTEFFADIRFGWVLLPLGIAAAAMGLRDRAIIFLAVLLIFQTVFWLAFTHLQSRFMVIAIPIVALLVAQIEIRRWNAAAAVGMAVLSVVVLTHKMWRYLEVDHTKVAIIGRENLEGFRLFDTRQLGDDQALDLIGDAGAFWYQIPMSRLHYKTVFDVDTTDPTVSIDQAWLAGMPKNAVVWTDRGELRRFARTYFGVEEPPQSGGLTDRSRRY
jgi:hypothetical protein